MAIAAAAVYRMPCILRLALKKFDFTFGFAGVVAAAFAGAGCVESAE
jgi:hypothetical protein